MAQGYCVHCKKKVTIKNPDQVRLKNGRPAVQGTCPDCGTKIFKMGRLNAVDTEESLKRKEKMEREVLQAFEELDGLKRQGDWTIVSCKDADSTWYEGRYDKDGVRVTISRADLVQLRQVIESTEIFYEAV